MLKSILIILLSLCISNNLLSHTASNNAVCKNTIEASLNALTPGLKGRNAKTDNAARYVPFIKGNTYTGNERSNPLNSPAAGEHRMGVLSMLLLFIQSLFAGLLAVFTPFIFTILPFTVGYLSQGAKTKSGKMKKTLYYALSIIIIFTLLGILLSVIITATGLEKYTEHWLFNLFLFRVFLILGISFMGAFSIKLPSGLVNSTASKAKAGSFWGIFYMALTLPGASFSSTGPIIGLVLVLSGISAIGPIIGLFGFAVGLSLPFVFPGIIKVFASSKSLLNNIKVVLGFFSLLIAMNFLLKADISFGLHLLDRGLFIVIWILLSVFMGVYMLGKIKLLHDYTPEQNTYGEEYVSLFRLFIAIASFTFALYLLPGLWGASLHAINTLLPQ